MEFKIISHGSDEYKEMVTLRSQVLRKPLGLHFDEEYLEKEKSTILIGCFKQDTMIACCLLRTISENVIQLQQMAVQPKLQGKHIGTKLIGFAEEHAKKAGFLKLFLHARKTAVGFYQKLGYEILGDEFEEVSIPHFMMKKEL
ncbi:GNAT family N-acetyltransferase [Desertivirga xinjiangensis]|uniref:GNAT family N-acetyltransferase n=1 Tax=Desertivirga xinjiangensis TaxID=539206 RepID=UPI00210AA939|nr:GNAT family N-acetyltransferase [Pedobacter xinjiangensis]